MLMKSFHRYCDGIIITIPVLTAINQFKESRKLFIKQTLFQALI